MGSMIKLHHLQSSNVHATTATNNQKSSQIDVLKHPPAANQNCHTNRKKCWANQGKLNNHLQISFQFQLLYAEFDQDINLSRTYLTASTPRSQSAGLKSGVVKWVNGPLSKSVNS